MCIGGMAFGEMTFYGCPIKTLEFPPSLLDIDIGEAAFRECDSLEKPVKLPASLTHTDEYVYVFSYGGALKITVNFESVVWKLSKQNKMRDGAPPTRK